MNRKLFIFLSRLALFVIYFWFGLLKVVTTSAANPLIEKLLNKTLPFVTFQQFIVAFGVFEMVIGILFLIGKFPQLTFFFFTIHMITTFLPLFLLTQVTWLKPGVPTLEGQYIIKNLALIALFFNVYK